MHLRFLGLSGLLSLLAAHSATAQKYNTAAGVRLGGGNYGITVQQRVASRVTIEGIAGLREREYSGTVLGEYHFGILGPSLNYYFGAGGHLGHNKDSGNFGGFDGIVGVEYKVAFLPIALSFDFKPSYEINSDDYARFPTAFSIRYVFIKRKTNLLDQIRGR
ncbi:hypothetical protein FNT36_11445 [Hymenobacter setariae]|uniref:Outer membrane protein beta-barrel domain-containing protein n=1 Tax=Hymenobacter setariae TaxID=2594794 RepID=A0A558BUA9_9BACT|nr:hypothetical protein [Hymenobacter setariae]TVT40107.1 hypothetical protein FNT36_11445 [Hymenobacter setariae]